MDLLPNVRNKLEQWATQRNTLLALWTSASALAYIAARLIHQLFGINNIVWLLFSMIAGLLAVAIAYAWSRISVLNRDGTTGLYRRMYADRVLTRIANQHTDVTLVMIDLNNLKALNDSLGHDAGDAFLHFAAGRLHKLHDVGRTISRYGIGDEFLIICEKNQDDRALADEVEEALHTKHPYDGAWGIGCAGICRTRTGETRVALECADAALYRAKRHYRATGHATIAIYDSHFDGEPKYTQHTTPPRPTTRRRDTHKK